MIMVIKDFILGLLPRESLPIDLNYLSELYILAVRSINLLQIDYHEQPLPKNNHRLARPIHLVPKYYY